MMQEERTLTDMAATEAAHVPNTMEEAERPVGDGQERSDAPHRHFYTDKLRLSQQREEAERPVGEVITLPDYELESLGHREDDAEQALAEFAEQMVYEYGDLPPVLELEAGRPISHTEANRLLEGERRMRQLLITGMPSFPLATDEARGDEEVTRIHCLGTVAHHLAARPHDRAGRRGGQGGRVT